MTARFASILIPLALLSLTSTGCAAFQYIGVTTEFEGELGPEKHIALTQTVHGDAIWNDSAHNFSSLQIVFDTESTHDEIEIAQTGGNAFIHTCFYFDAVTCRTDPTRRRFWFLDGDRVIASADFDMLRFTDPSDPAPEWATATAGEPVPPTAVKDQSQ